MCRKNNARFFIYSFRSMNSITNFKCHCATLSHNTNFWPGYMHVFCGMRTTIINLFPFSWILLRHFFFWYSSRIIRRHVISCSFALISRNNNNKTHKKTTSKKQDQQYLEMPIFAKSEYQKVTRVFFLWPRGMLKWRKNDVDCKRQTWWYLKGARDHSKINYN